MFMFMFVFMHGRGEVANAVLVSAECSNGSMINMRLFDTKALGSVRPPDRRSSG